MSYVALITKISVSRMWQAKNRVAQIGVSRQASSQGQVMHSPSARERRIDCTLEAIGSF